MVCVVCVSIESLLVDKVVLINEDPYCPQPREVLSVERSSQVSIFASYVAARCRVPVVQNLAWNVFTIDLSVAIVVVECDETQDLHRPNLEHRYNVSAVQLELLGVGDKEARQRILSQGFVMLPTQEQQHRRRLLALSEISELDTVFELRGEGPKMKHCTYF